MGVLSNTETLAQCPADDTDDKKMTGILIIMFIIHKLPCLL